MLKLIYAVEQSQNYSIEEILDIIKKNPNSVFESDLVEGYTALHYAAWDGKDQIVSLLLENGAKVDAKGTDGYTPFLLASNNNRLKSTDILVKNGADINIIIDDDNYLRGASGINAIRTAALNQNWEMFDYLIEKNADLKLLAEPCITPNGGYTNLVDVVRHLGLSTLSINHNEERLREFENLLKSKNLDIENNLENDVNEEDHSENKGYPLILRSNKKNEKGGIDDELNNRISEYLMNWQCPTESFNGRMGIKAFIPSWVSKIDNNDCCPKFSTNDISFINDIIIKEKIIPILRYAPEELYYHTKAIWWLVPFCIWAGDKASWVFIDKNGFYAAYPEDEDVTMIMTWDKIEEMEYSSEDFYTDEEEVHSLNLISESGELTFTEFVPKGRGSFLSVIESIYEIRKETIEASRGLAQWLEGSGGEGLKSIEHPSNLLKKESWDDPTRLNPSGFGFSAMESDEDLAEKDLEENKAENLFTDAKKHYDSKSYEKAIEVLQKYITLEVKKEGIINGLRLIAESYEELKDYTNAIHFYEEVIKLDPTTDFYFAHKGYCLKQDQKYSKAEEAFRKAVDLNPNNIWAYMSFGDVLKEQEKYAEAIEIYNEGIEKNPSQPKNTTSLFWLHQKKAHVYFDLKRWEEAIESYLKALEYDRNYGYTYYNLGISYYNIENYKNSYNNFEIVHEKDPDSKDSYSYYLKGECKRMLNENEQAIVEYDLSIKQDKEEHYTLHCNKMKGYCYLNLKDFSNAVDSFNKGLKDKWSYQNLGQAYFGLLNYEAALVNFNKVIEIDANYKWSYQQKGKTLVLLKKYQEAEECFSKVIEIDPNYKWAYHEKGKVFLKLNDHVSALKTFEKVIEIDANYKSVFYDLAVSYHVMGKYEKALDFYKKISTTKEKQNLLLHYNTIAAKNNKPPSLKSEEDLLKDTSDNFLLEALLERGKLEHYDNQGDFYPEISLKDFNKIIEIDPKFYMAYFFRAKLYLNSSYSKFYSIEKGTEDLKSCLDIKRYGPALIRYASLVSDFDEKNKLISEATKLDPDNAFAWQKYGEILYNNENYEGALEKFIKSNELESDGWSLQKIAKTYAALKLNDKAINFYNKAIKLVDWYENWMYELSEIYIETKQIDKAESSILKALNHYPKEKYYRQLYKIQCLKYPSDDYKSVLSDISDFIDSCNLDSGSNNEKSSDLEFLKTYENKLIFENKSIFSFFKFLKDETINYFIENGKYVTKLHLLKNQALNVSLDDIKKIISNSNYTVLETAISHQLVSSKMLDEIIDENDNSYLSSYKLLGVCSNPNVTEEHIDKLKSNKYNWVKQKAYSVTKEFEGIDTSDRYVLLGLFNNPNFNSSKYNYEKLLETTSPYNFTYKLNGGRVGIEEYSVGDVPEEDVFKGFMEVAPQDEKWSDYIANDWYQYGDSEYGVTDYVNEIDVWTNDESNIAIPSFVSHVHSWPTNEGNITPQTGEFVQIVSSGEKGEWKYNEFEMENEFRPENLHPKYTDSERAIEGYEYQLNEGDWIDIEGELSESTGSYTDIELILGTENGLVNIDFEEIKSEMKEQGLNPANETDVKAYFELLIKKKGDRIKFNEKEGQESYHREINITIQITGNGSEFNQGFITKDDYNKWLKHKETNQNWNEFCTKELSKDGYWDVSEISSFTGFNKDLISINIFINDQEFFSGNYNSLLDKFFEEEGEISQNINVSKNYGKYIFPKDGEWNTFFDNEEFEKRNKKLVTASTSEQFDISTKIKTYKNFSIEKLGFALISTDELGYGKDFGDFIRDIKYDGIELDIEFPGGVGDISEINIS